MHLTCRNTCIRWCEALSSRVGVGAALKGESGGGTRIVVEKSRFVDFLTSIKIKTARSTAVSNVSKVPDSMVRSTLLGVGSLRLERLQPMGRIWQTPVYNKPICFAMLLPFYDEYLCYSEISVQIRRTIGSRNCMNLVSYQMIVPDAQKKLCLIATSSPGERSSEIENIRNHSTSFT